MTKLIKPVPANTEKRKSELDKKCVWGIECGPIKKQNKTKWKKKKTGEITNGPCED